RRPANAGESRKCGSCTNKPQRARRWRKVRNKLHRRGATAECGADLRKASSKRPGHGAPRGGPHSRSKLDAGPRLATAEVGTKPSSRCTGPPFRGAVMEVEAS